MIESLAVKSWMTMQSPNAASATSKAISQYLQINWTISAKTAYFHYATSFRLKCITKYIKDLVPDQCHLAITHLCNSIFGDRSPPCIFKHSRSLNHRHFWQNRQRMQHVIKSWNFFLCFSKSSSLEKFPRLLPSLG